MIHPKTLLSNAFLVRAISVLSAALLLGGCSDLLRAPTPNSAWLLMPDRTQTGFARQANAEQFAIVVAPVSANSLLLSDQIWSITPDHTLSAQKQARWALAPDQMTQSGILTMLSDSHRYTAVLSQPQLGISAHQLRINLSAFWFDASAASNSATNAARISWDVQLRCQNGTISSTQITQAQRYDSPKQMHESMRSAFLQALQETQQWLSVQEQSGCSQPAVDHDGNARQ